jgi:sec-independent protein translocase protein TatA
MPGGPELIIILVVVLVLFGGSQLPKLAKNLGKAQKEFKDGMGEATATPPAAPPAAAAPPPPPPAAPASAPSDETK